MRVVVLTNEQPNQFALCSKLAQQCEIAAIVLSENVPRRKPPLPRSMRLTLNRVAGRLGGRALRDVWTELLGSYSDRYPGLPSTNLVKVRNVNDKGTVRVIEDAKPDLVVVSGTNLVGRRVIEAASGGRGIVNLHTGISPYVKGGPNCTNWCLAKGWFHLIGNTVMWLDLGIDTGNIIASEQTPLDGSETLFELHWKVMEHAHSMYCESITRILTGNKVSSVPQRELGNGDSFYSVEWTYRQMRRALTNFRKDYKGFFADSNVAKRASSGYRFLPLDSTEIPQE